MLHKVYEEKVKYFIKISYRLSKYQRTKIYRKYIFSFFRIKGPDNSLMGKQKEVSECAKDVPIKGEIIYIYVLSKRRKEEY